MGQENGKLRPEGKKVIERRMGDGGGGGEERNGRKVGRKQEKMERGKLLGDQEKNRRNCGRWGK